MKKQMTTKLTLSRETLRNLETKELGNIAGGQPNTTTSDPTYVISCSGC